MANILFNNGASQPMQQGQAQGQYLNQMLQLFKGSANPQSMLEHIAGQNPALQQVMQMCKGKDPKSVFFELCKQKGVDPQAFIANLKLQ